jgi:hypothetical protein
MQSELLFSSPKHLWYVSFRAVHYFLSAGCVYLCESAPSHQRFCALKQVESSLLCHEQSQPTNTIRPHPPPQTQQNHRGYLPHRCCCRPHRSIAHNIPRCPSALHSREQIHPSHRDSSDDDTFMSSSQALLASTPSSTCSLLFPFLPWCLRPLLNTARRLPQCHNAPRQQHSRGRQSNNLEAASDLSVH